MKNILLIIALVFSFGVSQSYAQKKSVSKVEKIVILELNKKEAAKSTKTSKEKTVKRKEVKKANKLIAKKKANAKVITVRPIRPPKPPTPPCICHPIDIIQNGLSLEQLLGIYPNATVVVSGQNKQSKEFKLSSSNSMISQKEFESLKGDVTVSIQLMNKRNRDNPAPIVMTLQR